MLQKCESGPPIIVAELFGPVPTSPFDEYFVGAADETNNTAELTAVQQAMTYLVLTTGFVGENGLVVRVAVPVGQLPEC